MGEQGQNQQAWWSRTLSTVAAFTASADTLILHLYTVSSYAVLAISAAIMFIAIYMDRRSTRGHKPAETTNLAPDRPPPGQFRKDYQPEPEFTRAPPDNDAGRISNEWPHVESTRPHYVSLRQFIGVIGIGLPLVLRIGILFNGGEVPSSISGYYYSSMRNIFVLSFCILGSLLMFYRGYNKLDRYFTTIAGIGFFGTALVPVKAPSSHSALPSWVHEGFFGCAILALAIVALLFTQTGFSTGQFKDMVLALGFKYPGSSRRKKARNHIYSICAWLMLVSLAMAYVWPVFIASRQIDDATQLIFWFETVAMMSFGTSWLVKSQTLPFLRVLSD